MQRARKSYAVNASPLYKLRSKHKLAALLRTRLDRLKHFGNGDGYYSFLLDGKTIWAPYKELKKIQRRFHRILVRVQTPDWHQSGKRGTSYICNARMHSAGRHLLTMDVASFYESTRIEYVFRCLRYTFQQSEDVAWLCARVITRDGSLPRGGPTSPLMSYWAYHSMFGKLHEDIQGKDHGSVVSLLIDDIAYSSMNPIGRGTPHEVDRTLQRFGLKLKQEKLRYFGAGDFKFVTGVAISPNHLLRIPNRRREAAIDQLRSEAAQDGTVKLPSDSLRGRAISERQIESSFLSSIL